MTKCGGLIPTGISADDKLVPGAELRNISDKEKYKTVLGFTTYRWSPPLEERRENWTWQKKLNVEYEERDYLVV